MKNIRDIILNNPELERLNTEILDHLTEKFGDDNERKVMTLIATLGYGFNNIFNSIPNMIITSEILKRQLENVDATDTTVSVATKMIEFITDFTTNINNDLIVEITEKLSDLTNEVKNKEGNNESTVNSKDD